MDKKCIVLKISNKYFNIESGLVFSIIRKGKVFTIPNEDNYIEGVIYNDGELIPVLNIQNQDGSENKERDYIVNVIYKNEKIGISAEEVLKLSDFEELYGKEIKMIEIISVLNELEEKNG